MIKLLADENIPKKAVEALKLKGIDITSVVDLSQGLSDRAVIELANNENRVLTQTSKNHSISKSITSPTIRKTEVETASSRKTPRSTAENA